MRFVVILLVAACSLHAQTDIPFKQREGESHKREAEAYFEQLHAVPEGFNWRAVNEAVRDARLSRVQMRDAMRMPTGVAGTWREIGSSNQAGRVVCVEYDHKTGRVWLAGAGGTIWSGDTTGKTWKCHSDARRIEDPQLIKLIKRPDGSEYLVVISGSPRVWLLDLATNTWSQATGLTEMQRWGGFSNAVAIKRGGRLEILAVGNEWDYGQAWKGRNVLYRSIDSGMSFQRLRWYDGQRQIWSDGEQQAWLLHGDTLSSIESDGSLKLLKLNPYGSSSGIRNVLFAGGDPGSVIMAVVKSDSTRFYLCNDNGVTWKKMGALDFGPFDLQSFHFAFENGFYLYGGVDTYRTDDDGVTWTKVNHWGDYYGNPEFKLHADIPMVKSFPEGVTFICTDGGAYISRNGGKSVRNITLKNLNISQYYGSYTSRNNTQVVSAGSQDQGFQRSQIDSGGVRSFKQTISGDYAHLVSGDNGKSLFCVYPGFVMYIPEHETGWSPKMRNFDMKSQLWLPPLSVRPSKPGTTYLAGGTKKSAGAYVYTYTFMSTDLVVDSLKFDFSEGANDVRLTEIEFARSNDNIGYVLTSNGNVFVTTDAGATWTKKARPQKLGGHYFHGNALAIDAVNPSRIVIGGTGYDSPAAYISTDGGSTFTALNGLPPCLVLTLAMSDDGRYIAAATDVGAFIYDVQQQTWTDITELGAPDQTYWHVDRVEPLGIFRFSTYGRGIWDFTITGITSAPEQNISTSALTLSGELLSGTPSVRITSDRETDATIVWYDLAGRRYAQENIRVQEGTRVLGIPEEARRHGARTCVITTADGTVAACLAP
jgi:photosystem II stability/assembly factor-like uncharacterized protein